MSVIYALSSGVGKSGVAVIRLSGAGVQDVVSALAGGVPTARRASLRRLRDLRGDTLDHAIVIWFPGPASFTGEDCAELHVHGSRAVVAAVLAALASTPGCRPAEAGEFSRRAFLNGRLDLIDLEGLADLVESQTEAQRKRALAQMNGRLRQRIDDWSDLATRLQAELEAELDFSDEGDVTVDLSSIRARCQCLADECEGTLREARSASAIRAGCRIGIVGPPNAGKSSLLNRLAGHEAAIVSDQPGTTRDIVEVYMDFGGLPLRIADSAGLRDAVDAVEAIGVQRATELAETADIVVWLSVEEAPPGWMVGDRIIAVASQRDRFHAEGLPHWAAFGLSSVTGDGVGALLEELRARALQCLGGDDDLILQDRQRRLIESAATRIRTASKSAEPEVAAEELRGARMCLARAVGLQAPTDVLDDVFGRFCIGK